MDLGRSGEKWECLACPGKALESDATGGVSVCLWSDLGSEGGDISTGRARSEKARGLALLCIKKSPAAAAWGGLSLAWWESASTMERLGARPLGVSPDWALSPLACGRWLHGKEEALAQRWPLLLAVLAACWGEVTGVEAEDEGAGEEKELLRSRLLMRSLTDVFFSGDAAPLFLDSLSPPCLAWSGR